MAFHLLQGDTTLDSRRLKDESEKVLGDSERPQLVAKYLHGVGDTDNPIKKVVGGAFGSGLIARIVRGYTFISRQYQPGDRIVILGFSRGAYTARALAGMISGVGLLDPKATEQTASDRDAMAAKERAYRMGVSAWLRYRENAKAKQQEFDRQWAENGRLDAADRAKREKADDIQVEAFAVAREAAYGK